MSNADTILPDTYTLREQDRRRFLVELSLVFLAFVALFVKSIPVIYIEVLVLGYVILRCNIYENVFGFIVFFPNVAGYIFNPIGISHVGGIIKYLGFAILIVMVFLKKAYLKNLWKGMSPLIILLLLFTLSVFTTMGGDHAIPKLISTTRHGLMVFFAYSFLFSNIEKFDFTKIGMLYLVLAIFLIPMSIPVNGISGPAHLLDFGFLRNQTHEDFFAISEEDVHISYQGSGFLLLIAFGFFLINSKRNNLRRILLVISIVFLSQLYIGSRQAIISIIVMTIVWAFLYSRDKLRTNSSKLLYWFFLLVPILVAMFYVIKLLIAEGGLLYSVAEEGYIEGAGRGEWLLSGIYQFLEHPIWGVGYGRYVVLNHYGSYPHNLFVELLCETGIIGCFIAVVLGISAAIQNKKVFTPFIVLWLAYFLRSMVSGDISLNIYVFVIIFALYSSDYKIEMKTIV